MGHDLRAARVSVVDARARLEAKEAQVQEALQALTRHGSEHTRAALARCLGESEPIVMDRERAVTAHRSLTDQLEQVRSALTALDDGSYGRCRVCQQPIAEGRLEARPWATTCTRHG